VLVIDGVPLRRRLGSAYARARLAEALFDIALEGMDPDRSSRSAAAARAWLRVALEVPIGRASDAALDRFCAELELVAIGAPAHVRDALCVSHGAAGDVDVVPTGAGRPAGASRAPSQGSGG